MTLWKHAVPVLCGGALVLLAACGGRGGADAARTTPTGLDAAPMTAQDRKAKAGGSILGLFSNQANPNTTVEVNKYLWQASLEVLNFLPIESVDPFTGVIVTGYGTPPGGGRAYRATVYVQDPALDARSLKVALQSRGGGAVSAETQRAVEDAILTRARQLRVRDSNL
ncbi:DUF3576 domain-containing protein [Pseudogemmobacter blasticus]|uniref:DUF3576 domain-containing protein n=1 Tax=Fuscovulum blasticum DSM 2131 TaxID=1188250 RepID=A0A2T4JF57_FUSBL|nr:DUF3576 domain-containing protein [Fuscovulum blasticum]PTE16541.1 DUF3576 domain-containing protein [Fuscovulum blasticum DSM 2131]